MIQIAEVDKLVLKHDVGNRRQSSAKSFPHDQDRFRGTSSLPEVESLEAKTPFYNVDSEDLFPSCSWLFSQEAFPLETANDSPSFPGREKASAICRVVDVIVGDPLDCRYLHKDVNVQSCVTYLDTLLFDNCSISMTPSPPLGLNWRSSTSFILLTVAIGLFTDLFLYGLVVPVLPFILTSRLHVPSSQIQSHVSVLLAAYAGARSSSPLSRGWWPIGFRRGVLRSCWD